MLPVETQSKEIGRYQAMPSMQGTLMTAGMINISTPASEQDQLDKTLTFVLEDQEPSR